MRFAGFTPSQSDCPGQVVLFPGRSISPLGKRAGLRTAPETSASTGIHSRTASLTAPALCFSQTGAISPFGEKGWLSDCPGNSRPAKSRSGTASPTAPGPRLPMPDGLSRREKETGKMALHGAGSRCTPASVREIRIFPARNRLTEPGLCGKLNIVQFGGGCMNRIVTSREEILEKAGSCSGSRGLPL